MGSTITLYTDRLILRKYKLSDSKGMYENWATDPLTNRYLSWDLHPSEEFTREVISEWIKDYDKDDTYNWIVELKDTNEVIGGISVVRLNKAYSVAEVGYCYGSKYWGKGYATEALRRVIEYLLLDAGIYLVEAKHISGNPASGKVMMKAGMKFDTVLRDRAFNKATNERNDYLVYSIKKNEL